MARFWTIRWDAKLKDLARAKGKGLFAVASDRADGRDELYGTMEDTRCIVLMSFARLLSQGLRPQEALDETMAGLTDLSRSMLAERAPESQQAPDDGDPDHV